MKSIGSSVSQATHFSPEFELVAAISTVHQTKQRLGCFVCEHTLEVDPGCCWVRYMVIVDIFAFKIYAFLV